jgi:hypothetical protein
MDKAEDNNSSANDKRSRRIWGYLSAFAIGVILTAGGFMVSGGINVPLLASQPSRS